MFLALNRIHNDFITLGILTPFGDGGDESINTISKMQEFITKKHPDLSEAQFHNRLIAIFNHIARNQDLSFLTQLVRFLTMYIDGAQECLANNKIIVSTILDTIAIEDYSFPTLWLVNRKNPTWAIDLCNELELTHLVEKFIEHHRVWTQEMPDRIDLNSRGEYFSVINEQRADWESYWKGEEWVDAENASVNDSSPEASGGSSLR